MNKREEARRVILSATGQGLYAAFRDLLEEAVARQQEELEHGQNVGALWRAQGGLQVLRQLVKDITPRSKEERKI